MPRGQRRQSGAPPQPSPPADHRWGSLKCLCMPQRLQNHQCYVQLALSLSAAASHPSEVAAGKGSRPPAERAAPPAADHFAAVPELPKSQKGPHWQEEGFWVLGWQFPAGLSRTWPAGCRHAPACSGGPLGAGGRLWQAQLPALQRRVCGPDFTSWQPAKRLAPARASARGLQPLFSIAKR